jgi:ABC-type uncharacterized transport system permease subunit
MVKFIHRVRGKRMKPITIIYWLRVAIGMTTGVICAVLSNFLITNGIVDGISVLLYSISLALVIYLITLQVLKSKFQNQVETPSKITMTAIGMYFISWLAFYVLFYTIIYVNAGGILNELPLKELA